MGAALRADGTQPLESALLSGAHVAIQSRECKLSLHSLYCLWSHSKWLQGKSDVHLWKWCKSSSTASLPSSSDHFPSIDPWHTKTPAKDSECSYEDVQLTVPRERSTRAKKQINYAELGDDSPFTHSNGEVDVTWRR